MIWRIRYQRNGGWTRDATPYQTFEAALAEVKRLYRMGLLDLAEIEDADERITKWEEIKDKIR